VIAVFDTSPLHYLVLIGEIDLLPQLFHGAVIPPAVRSELAAPGAPERVRAWIERPPDWLRVRDAPDEPHRALAGLHRGERAAIQLAQTLAADILVLDDKAARAAATALGIRITGLLGILDLAAQRGLVRLSPTVDRLRSTSFRATPSLLHSLLGLDPGERGT
jgi:predicted nucleic acid-binding protein